MDEDWRNAFGILMFTEICNGAGVGICDGAPSTCSSYCLHLLGRHLFLCHGSDSVENILMYIKDPEQTTVKLRWLEHLWDHRILFETWVVRANEG